MMTSPIKVRPEDCTILRKPDITETTTMTSATHSATAPTAMSGMTRLVKYRDVSSVWYTGCSSYYVGVFPYFCRRTCGHPMLVITTFPRYLSADAQRNPNFIPTNEIVIHDSIQHPSACPVSQSMPEGISSEMHGIGRALHELMVPQRF